MPELMPIVNELESELAEVTKEVTKWKDKWENQDVAIGIYQDEIRLMQSHHTQQVGMIKEATKKLNEKNQEITKLKEDFKMVKHFLRTGSTLSRGDVVQYIDKALTQEKGEENELS